ncbi:hypothetical protein J132_06683 [Termitomyces sp. J132]|nr:hypothetical protein J132_06683 [Termitomyces sp. J132]
MHPRLSLILEQTKLLSQEGKIVKQKTLHHPPSSNFPKISSSKLSKQKLNSGQASLKTNYQSTAKDSLLSPSGSVVPSSSISHAGVSDSGTMLTMDSVDTSGMLEKMDIDTPPITSLISNDSPVFVHERLDLLRLQGHVLTCAPKNDRLPAFSGKKIAFQHQYYTPEELDLIKISHWPDVYKQCGKDVVILINAQKTSEMVGAVEYEAAGNTTIGHLMSYYHAVSHFRSVKHGPSFEAWKYDQMHAIGSRQPQGGHPGDGYAEYEGIEAGTDAEICTMFQHAKAADILTHLAEAMHRPVTKKIIQESEKDDGSASLNRLGSTGNNLFVCTDYMSPQHIDHDDGISITMQYDKNCQEDEFNFAFTQWGHYIETKKNCLCYFIAIIFMAQ